MKWKLLTYGVTFAACLLAGWLVWGLIQTSRALSTTGTILVYEIDAASLKNKEAGPPIDPIRLAALLQKRLNPDGKSAIVVRPAPQAERVEVVLQSGGGDRLKKANAAWDAILQNAKDGVFVGLVEDGNFPADVKRGHLDELAARIQMLAALDVWERKLFPDNTPEGEAAWKRLKSKAAEDFAALNLEYQLNKVAERNLGPALETDVKQAEAALARAKLPADINNATLRLTASKKKLEDWDRRKGPILADVEAQTSRLTQQKNALNVIDKSPRRIRAFTVAAYDIVSERDPSVTMSTMENWVQGQAWLEVLGRVRREDAFKDQMLDQVAEEMDRIPPDHIEQVIRFVQAKGVLPGQAGLAALEPLVGQFQPQEGPSRAEIADYLRVHYGPSASEIKAKIIERSPEQVSQVVDEAVERINESLQKPGMLEFRILANSVDDVEAIRDVKAHCKSPDADLRARLEHARRNGLAPPVVADVVAGRSVSRIYDIKVGPNREPARAQYAWVELGQPERISLHLSLGSKNDPSFGFWYKYVSQHLDEAFFLPDGRDFLRDETRLQGALFYARRTQSLPKVDAYPREFDIFVLSRLPEFPARITGDYIVHASSAMHITPIVQFEFNEQGADLIGELTRKNLPDRGDMVRGSRRHLAILLDNQVMTAPTINSVIRKGGMITGNFTKKEVEQMAGMLSSGGLPVAFKPEPVAERALDPADPDAKPRRLLRNRWLYGGGLALLAVAAAVVLWRRRERIPTVVPTEPDSAPPAPIA